jgi:phosphatidylinositol kinase/protein kinase (PI-3  family)
MNTKPIDPNEDLSQDKSFSEINIENVVQVINKGTNQIIERLTALANFDHNDGNKMAQLVQQARNPDCLCQMDPSYQPWL